MDFEPTLHGKPLSNQELADQIRGDLRQRLFAGEAVTAEQYFRQFPDLLSETERAVDVIYAEFLVREELGESPRSEHYLQRFPQFRTELIRQFEVFEGLIGSGIPEDSRDHTIRSQHEDLAPSSLVPRRIGRFQISEQLGSGGFAAVYRAFDSQLGREVALKIPHFHLMSDEYRERFLREARAAAQLHHPNLVAVYDSGVESGQCFIANQLVVGESLAESLTRRRYDFVESATLVLKLAQAAHHAHGKGIFHRDLKTANVLVDEQGEPYISDFGLVRLEGDSTLTAEQAILGTLDYMSPEQAAGTSHKADGRSDVYSLGVVFYELLTHRLPFAGTPHQLLQTIVEEEPRRLRSINSSVPRDLETICLKAMSKSPEARYPSAQHLADDLNRWLSHEAILARPVGVAERFIKWTRRRPAVAALVLISSIATLSLAFGFVATRQYRLRQSLHQAANGVLLLEQRNSLGLLDLLEARRTAGGLFLTEASRSRSLLWSGWHAAQRGRLAMVVGHNGGLYSARFSPDGKLLVTSGADNLARLWHPETGQPICPPVPTGILSKTLFSPDGDLLLTRSAEGSVEIRDPRTGKVSYPPIWDDNLTYLALSPDGELVCTGSKLWEVRTGELRAGPFDIPGTSVAFSPDSKVVALGSGTGEIGFFRTDTGAPVAPRLRHDGQLMQIKFSPDGSVLASSAWETHTVRIWDRETGRSRGGALPHRENIHSLAFSPDSRLLASGSFDGEVKLWDTQTGRLTTGPMRHEGAVFDLAFQPPHGKLLAAASKDTTCRLWDSSTGQPVGWPLRHQRSIQSVAFNPDGRSLVTASMDGTARVWNVATPAPKILRGHGHRVWDVALCANEQLAVTGTEDGFVYVWDRDSAEPIHVLRHAHQVLAVAISPDASQIASATTTVKVWDLETGKLMAEPVGEWTVVRALEFSPDGVFLAAAGQPAELRGGARIWKTADWRPQGPIMVHQEAAYGLAFSPDSKTIATGSEDRTAVIWDTADGSRSRTFRHPADVGSLAFAASGKLLATGSSDLTIRLFDIGSGALVGQPYRQSSAVQSLAFSPTDKMLLAASFADGTVRLLDLQSGLPCSPPMRHGWFATAIAFGSSGKSLVSGSFDKTARIWKLPQHTSGLQEMTLQTWVSLGARLNSEGSVEAIGWREWQRLHETIARR